MSNHTKSELRATLLAERTLLGVETSSEMSGLIVTSLKNAVDWSKHQAIHCYEPLLRTNEVNIRPFVVWLFANFPDTHVYTTRKIDKIWQHTTWDSGVAQPVPKLDVVVVPMLGFDNELHRLGYGGGFYDQFLSAQPDAYKIGVCLEQGNVGELPLEDHDIPMDVIITESGQYN